MMAASTTIFPGCRFNTAMTLAIKGIAMQGIAHADIVYRYILASIIMYLGISISFPLHVELSDHHCCIP